MPLHEDVSIVDVRSDPALRSIVTRHLRSDDGAAGVDRLVAHMWAEIPALKQAWRLWLETSDPKLLNETLEPCGCSCEERSLRATDYLLRSWIDYDVYVRSSIFWALLEYVSEGETDSIFAYAQKVSGSDYPPPWSFRYVIGLLLARLQIEKGLFREAGATAKRLETAVCSPYSQYLMYLALAQQKAAGIIISAANINLDDLSDHFCAEPFITLASGPSRDQNAVPQLYACKCAGHLPFPISDGSNSQTAEEVWNGITIQEIRRSIHEGDFKYCSRLGCPDLVGRTLPKKKDVIDADLRSIIDDKKTVLESPPRVVSLSHDASCNLACPICRKDLFLIKNEQRTRLDEFVARVILPLLEDGSATVHLSGDGDPFASKHYRQFLRQLNPDRHSKLKLRFLTNGLLLTEREWVSLSNIHPMVEEIAVSIDGAQAPTYEDLRRPGKWDVICRNMEYLGQLHRAGDFWLLRITFVIQKKNYREIPDIIRLGKRWGVDKIGFLKLINTGTYDAAQFVENDICDPRHPEHEEFLEVLRDPIVLDPQVDFMTVKPYVEEAQKSIQERDPWPRRQVKKLLTFLSARPDASAAKNKVKDAAAMVSAETGEPRRKVYARAIELSAGEP